ncbi:GNAT family N-acetyltransferase, partial [Microbacterium sp. ISL-103]|uniref:GNAT family N-acetyltransferase n=1 Tax=Microbacterium sp. ISL-103 TaxID=2819156 RepID=UPI001BE5CB19
VHPDRLDSHVSVMLDGDTVRGAAYAAHAGGVGDVLLSQHGVEGLAVTAQIQSIDAIAVDPKYRGRGYGTTLLNSLAAHAYRDFSARYFVTRIDAEKTRALSWFEDRGFEICKPGTSFTVGGVPMMPAAGYRDAWAPLSDLPAFVRK